VKTGTHVKGSTEKKEGGTRTGAREQALTPRSCPPPHHRQRSARPQRNTAACSRTHDGPTCASAGAQMPDPHGIHEWWCWCQSASSPEPNQSINQSQSHTHGQGEATSQHSHRGQQTLCHEVPQAWGEKNESRQHPRRSTAHGRRLAFTI